MDGHLYIADLEPGEIHAVYQVADARRLTTRTNKPYLAMTFRDNTGRIGAKRWDCSDHEADIAKPGAFIEIRAKVEIYRDQPQIIVTKMRVAPDELIDPNAFEETPDFDPDVLMVEVVALLQGLEDPDYRAIAESYLTDDAFMARFGIGPAAKNMHHPYRFGLLEHVHSVLLLGDAMCRHYRWVDRSLVLLGLFVHDSGKVVELVGEEAPSYSVEGELLGHITIGINMLDRKLLELPDVPHDKGVYLKHVILSHHGLAEWGSPKPPMLAEAQIVHTIEMLDARMNAFYREIQEPPEVSDATGGLRWSKLLKRKILTRGSLDEATGESGGATSDIVESD